MLDVLFANFDYLLRGALVTVVHSLICVSAGTALGCAFGIAATIAPPWVRGLITAYVFVIRGIPILVLMFLAYFALPAFGVHVSNMVAVGGALVFYTAAYMTEIARGSLEAVPFGQVLAARSIGMRWWQTLRHVTIPQAIKPAIPPLMNTSVIMIKQTSYASVVGVWELTYAAKEVVERTIEPFAIFLGVMILYFAICYPVSVAADRLERRFAYAH
jgi:polar amino acid transport system permease protein